MDIIAERVSQDPENRAAVKKLYLRDGFMTVKGVGDDKKKESSTYQMYWDYREPLSTLKPHRVLAVNRGEREGELEVSLEVDEDGAVKHLADRYATRNEYHTDAIDDGLRRLLSPAVLREIRSEAMDQADGHGISVFSENLKNLLMQRPSRARACSASIPASGPAPSAPRSTRPASSWATSSSTRSSGRRSQEGARQGDQGVCDEARRRRQRHRQPRGAEDRGRGHRGTRW